MVPVFNWRCVWVWYCTSSFCDSIMYAVQDQVKPDAPFTVLYLGRMCQCGLHVVLWSYIGTLMLLLAAEHSSTTGLLFHCQYLCGTILVTPYSMVWDRRVSRDGPMPSYWPSCLLLFWLQLLSFSLPSFYGLVLWGWGIRTYRIALPLSDRSMIAMQCWIALSHQCIAKIKKKNNNNNSNNNKVPW